MDWVARASEIGFERVAVIEDASSIVLSEMLAASCSPKTCPKYASCWSCPPGAGSFEELKAHFEGKTGGVIVQTVRENVDYMADFELLAELLVLHNERLDTLANEMRQACSDVIELSTGGCGLCDPCTYPDAPCQKSDVQRLSISAHGVDLDKTCKNIGIDYSFENGRIRFVGIILMGAA